MKASLSLLTILLGLATVLGAQVLTVTPSTLAQFVGACTAASDSLGRR